MVNWFSSLRAGLTKSSDKISANMNSIFNKKKLGDDILLDLEELLLSADLGYKATSEIMQNFAKQKFDKNASVEEIKDFLANDIARILKPCESKLVLDKKPHVVLMVGVNGAGKTTTIGKIAHKFGDKQISFVAADTFRAAAVEQLCVWGKRNNVKVYSGNLGTDAASLCFDSLQKAIEQGDDLVFIDTAGRLQNKTNLNDELKKIIRVIKKVIPDAPHHTCLCLDAATGQNALEQVKVFKEVAEVNGLIINKLDGSAKGGIVVSIAVEHPTPIYYIGVGEGLDDLGEFDAQKYAQSLLGI